MLSCPQLFGLVPCPRHRVPFVDTESRTLYPSCVRLTEHALPTRLMLALLEQLGCVQRIYDECGQVVGTTNLTLLNALLVLRGVRVAPASKADLIASRSKTDPVLRPAPVRHTLCVSEHTLWYYTMGVQALGSAMAFMVRYWLSSIIFPAT